MKIVIRDMQKTDIEKLYQGFNVMQGWKDKTIEQFTSYFKDHTNGNRYVLVAECNGDVAGYLTLLPNDEHGPFAGQGIPTVCDFNVLIKYRENGVGTLLMDEVEKLAKKTSNSICLGVGLYRDYGKAQRMYVKRGYIPDGSGVWWNNQNIAPGTPCVNDDKLILYLSKKL